MCVALVTAAVLDLLAPVGEELLVTAEAALVEAALEATIRLLVETCGGRLDHATVTNPTPLQVAALDRFIRRGFRSPVRGFAQVVDAAAAYATYGARVRDALLAYGRTLPATVLAQLTA